MHVVIKDFRFFVKMVALEKRKLVTLWVDTTLKIGILFIQ